MDKKILFQVSDILTAIDKTNYLIDNIVIKRTKRKIKEVTKEE